MTGLETILIYNTIIIVSNTIILAVNTKKLNESRG